MATAPDVGDQQEIICPLCLDTFREPKLLSCGHVYCKSPCLEDLLLGSINNSISCPECCVVTQVTANDVNDLRTAFHVNRLKETEVVVRGKNCPKQDEAVASTIGGTDRQVVNMLCKLHPSRSLDIFCGTCTCQRLICRDCVAVDRTHEKPRLRLGRESSSRIQESFAGESESRPGNPG